MALRRRHISPHGRTWRWLWLRCRCRRWWHCPGTTSVIDAPYTLTPTTPILAVPTWLPTPTPSPHTATTPTRCRTSVNRGPTWNAATGHHTGRAGHLTPAQRSRVGAVG
ncbi:hypothetical protein [Micromonospora sp. HM5-17]|uniref:hypothetical protein n=1 Tax=Micromonospora sp. HM5-17 TaxID=2487710 RepID=UPI0013156468|nr:hypothetical protein [Micromonospora sp. HM5-17]